MPFGAIAEGRFHLHTIELRGNGTHYIAAALHRDEESHKQHEDMGFHDGWGKALDQLVAYVKTIR